MTRQKGSAGFSTLEVMVSITILATLLIPLIGIQMSTTRAYERNEQAYKLASAERSLLDILRHLNPMTDPEGTIDLQDGIAARWSSVRLREPILSTQYPTGDGAFEVGYYKVIVTLEQRGIGQRTFEIERVGWKAIGSPTETLSDQPNPEWGIP